MAMRKLIFATTAAFVAGLSLGVSIETALEPGGRDAMVVSTANRRVPSDAVNVPDQAVASSDASSDELEAQVALDACERKVRSLLAAEEALDDAHRQLEYSLREALGEPVAFPSGVTADAARRRIRTVVESTLGPENVIELRCEEYPCLVFARVPVGRHVPELGEELAESGLRSGLAFRLRPPLPGERDHRLVSIAVAEVGGTSLTDPRVQKRMRSRVAEGFEAQGPM